MERKPDISEWNAGLKKEKLVDSFRFEQSIEERDTKKERLEKSGLPYGISYGPYDTFEEIEKEIPESKINKTYFIKCIPKNKYRNEIPVLRKPKISLEEAKKYFKDISEGSNKYKIHLFETWEPDYSGGIVINSGRVMVDLEKGDRYFIKEEVEKVLGASLDTKGDETGIDIHFSYQNEPLPEEKEIMMKALKYLNKDLKRDKFEEMEIYADFMYSRKNGFKFIDYFEGENAKKYTSRPKMQIE